MRRALALTCIVVLAFVAAACGPATVEVKATAGSASLAKGETLRVDFGDINESIGDSWYLVTQPDATILTEKDQVFDSRCGQPGCASHMTWLFAAVGPGTTTVVFQYCYRTRPENCDNGPGRGPADPVHLTVTVAPA
jgi:predicted secreted protein